MLEDVFREEAARETGDYSVGPEQDRSLAAVHLRTRSLTGQASDLLARSRAPDSLPLVTEASEPEAVPTPPDRSSLATPAATAVTSTESLASLTEAFFEKRVREKIRHQGIAQERTTLRLFFDILGDRPARDYRRQDITTFLDTLRRLPSSYGKSPKDKELSVEELIARAEATGAPRLADKTVKRHLSALSVFSELAVDRGHISLTERNNVIGEHDFALGDAREARDQWTYEELGRLFSSAVWTGRDPARRSAPGTEITRDARFWIPLLCVFQGTRLEEVADLRRKDVTRDTGVSQLELTTEHRRLKNHSARRTIPIHPELIRLGLVEYVAKVSPCPTDPLFPDLEPQGADVKRGARITR